MFLWTLPKDYVYRVLGVRDWRAVGCRFNGWQEIDARKLLPLRFFGFF
jgi:hypothetical protein